MARPLTHTEEHCSERTSSDLDYSQDLRLTGARRMDFLSRLVSSARCRPSLLLAYAMCPHNITSLTRYRDCSRPDDAVKRCRVGSYCTVLYSTSSLRNAEGSARIWRFLAFSTFRHHVQGQDVCDRKRSARDMRVRRGYMRVVF